MRVQRIAEGLWRWTAAGPSGEELGAVYLEAPQGVVLVDPVLPGERTEDRARFWRALDRDVARAGPAVHLLRTHPDEGPALPVIAARYPGAREAAPPAGIEALAVPGSREVLLWIAAHRALVASRLLAGTADGRTLVCTRPVAALGGLPATLGALPVEVVLVARGEPVLEHARTALAQALTPSR